MTERRRRLLPAAILVSGLVVTGCAGFDTWQRQTIFGTGQDQTRWYREAPAGTEQYDLTLADGDRIHAWYLAGARPDAPTVLYLHGTRWNLNNSVFRVDRLHGLGANVLAIDYRGFGRSTQRLPSEDSAMHDVRAALVELARRQPDPSRRFVYGHSLGGALAIQAAAASAEPGFAGLIVESTFTSIADIVTGSRWGWIPGLTWLISQRFDSATRIASVRIPVLFIHGTADSIVPSSMSEKLYTAATAVPAGFKELLLIDGGSHSGASRMDPTTYNRAMRGFMQRAGDLAAARTTAPLAGHPDDRPASLAASPEPARID